MSRLAIFIDADNFNDSTALDYAMQEVRSLGEPVALKYAYGNASSLKGIEVVMGKYGIRPVSNLVVGKTTTDVALAIGAMEMVCSNPQIKVVVICSGDADFAPLALRLREMGCKVIAVGMSHNLFTSAEVFYDDVLTIQVVDEPVVPKPPAPAPVLPVRQAAPAAAKPAPVPPPAAVASLVTPVVVQAPLKIPPAAQPVNPVKTPVKETGHSIPAAVPASVVPINVHATVQQVLKVCPVLRNGSWQHLSQIVQALRSNGILPQNAKSSAWLARLAPHFELTPAIKPNQVRYRMGCAASPKTAPVMEAGVQEALAAYPVLSDGSWQPLNQVIAALRQSGLLGNTESLAWFEARNAYFDVEMEPGRTHQVRYLQKKAKPAASPQVAEPASLKPTAASTPIPPPVIQSWHISHRREATVPLPSHWNALRQVLVQVAAQRVCVADILLAAPELLLGQPCSYPAVASRFREKKLVLPNQTILKILQRHPQSFKLDNPQSPKSLIYLGGCGGGYTGSKP